MNWTAFLRFVFPAIGAASVAVVVLAAQEKRHIGSYPHMAPLAQYLMDRDAEIALARSAAPSAISKDARVLVLTPHGYVTAITGTNGFTCIVERSWMDAFDDTQFWNPKMRSPICYNPPASRTILVYDYTRTKLALAHLSKSQIFARFNAMVANKAIPTPEPGSMSYMMSKQQYINDAVANWYPMLMFNAPKADGANAGASWGANVTNSPVVMDSAHKLWPEPQTLFIVPVARWSDGTPGPPL